MSNELQVNLSVQVRAGQVDYFSRPTTWQDDLVLGLGPKPGLVQVTPVGVDIDFSPLVLPGPCWIQNLDDTDVIEYGIWDPLLLLFHPLGEIKPGKFYFIYLSRNLAQQYGTGPGTGTANVTQSKFRLRSYDTTCFARVDAFEASES